MMDTTLRATLTKTHRGEPLAVVDNLPGGGAELTPAQLRALAASLQRIADDCEARPRKGKHWTPGQGEYPVTLPPISA